MATDIEIHGREIMKMRERIEHLYAHHSGRTVDEVHRDIERDRFFKPEEALAYGLIDKVIASHRDGRITRA